MARHAPTNYSAMIDTHQDWEALRSRLHGFILRRINDPQDAEDVLHDVLLKMHENITGIRDQDKLQAWAYQIARNAIIDHHRQHKAHTTCSAELEAVDDLPLETDSLTVMQEIAGCLLPMIEQLPYLYRDSVMLTDIEGVSQREVAERLGISLSGAKSRVQRGREKLREMLLHCCRLEFDRNGRLIGYCSRAECP